MPAAHTAMPKGTTLPSLSVMVVLVTSFTDDLRRTCECMCVCVCSCQYACAHGNERRGGRESGREGGRERERQADGRTARQSQAETGDRD